MKNILQISFRKAKSTLSALNKRISVLFVVCAFSMLASAGTYSYLEFTNTSGAKTAFNVTNLSLTISNNTLQIRNDEGSVDFTLTDLESMQFTTNCTTSVDNILNADAPVQVLTLNGALVGTYPSLVDAAKCLSVGVYVISNGDISQTIVIK